MRRSARLAAKKTNPEKDAERKPKAKKSRSDDKILNITLDNDTMVEIFKHLNYCQLAKSSHVSYRYWSLIRSHRHKFALFDVDRIYINYVENPTVFRDPVIKMFNKELSPKEYNKWIVRNGYSKQIPLEDSNYDITTIVLRAHVELKDKTWPLFQHFIRLLVDPFVLLAGAMNPDRDRLQCKQLNIRFNGDTQKFIVWIKDHVRCDEFEIYVNSDSNYDEELLDLFLTGAPCTSAINVKYYDLSKVIVDLVQKFMGLKNRDEYQVVESIRGNVEDRGIVEELKRNCAEFIAEEEQYEEGSGTRQIIGFINNDIEKKLTLNHKWREEKGRCRQKESRNDRAQRTTA
ncbi:hypothetical protein Ddc_24543 [Ditylenchus destructor]|nr:hypothetical protein Ddc_24543 [Ditylenchus destructor]